MKLTHNICVSLCNNEYFDHLDKEDCECLRQFSDFDESFTKVNLDEYYNTNDPFVKWQDKHFKYFDEVVEYYDLEKGYENKTLILNIDGKLYGLSYTYSPVWSEYNEELKEYESYEETITKYRRKSN